MVVMSKRTHCNFHRHPNQYIAHCLAVQCRPSIGSCTHHTVNCWDHHNLCPAGSLGLMDDEGGQEGEALLALLRYNLTFFEKNLRKSVCAVVRLQ